MFNCQQMNLRLVLLYNQSMMNVGRSYINHHSTILISVYHLYDTVLSDIKTFNAFPVNLYIYIFSPLHYYVCHYSDDYPSDTTTQSVTFSV